MARGVGRSEIAQRIAETHGVALPDSAVEVIDPETWKLLQRLRDMGVISFCGGDVKDVVVRDVPDIAEMEAKKDLLAFKQELVSEAFAAAVERIANLPKEEYVRFLADLAAKASQFRCEELIFNARDAAAVGKDVVKAANALLGADARLTVSEETRDIPGGFIAKQGSIETNCAVDTMVLLRRGDLAAQVAELLFE